VSNELIWMSQATTAIARVATIPAAKELVDRVAAYSKYARLQEWSLEQRAEISEIEIRATIKLGELLKETVVPKGNHSHGTSGSKKSLPSQITKKQYGREKPEPELSLEKWSVLPSSGRAGKVGWTLDESKLTDYTLHVFDFQDSREVFLLPFQLLRQAFRRNVEKWYSEFFHASQSSKTWESECVFVPACVVLESLATEMRPTTALSVPSRPDTSHA